jgi:hypothetical protein
VLRNAKRQLTASNRLLRTGVAIDTPGYKQMALSRPIVARYPVPTPAFFFSMAPLSVHCD